MTAIITFIFDKPLYLKENKFPESALNLRGIFKMMERIVPPIKRTGDIKLNSCALTGELCNQSSRENECDKPKLYFRSDPVTK